MKKIIYSFFIVSFLAVAGCNDFLETEPKTQIPSDQALSKGTNVEATLIAAYSNLMSGDFLGFRVKFYSELLGDNIALNEIAFSSTDFTGQVAFRNSNIFNIDVDGLWSNGYLAIARANAVIRAIDEGLITDGTSLSSQALWKAEALFIRGVAHFELVRLFGHPYSKSPATDLGIPIRTRSLTADEKLPRATVEEVYDQVIDDLQDAINTLPVINGNRASKTAAQGYLARVYFNKLDYAAAFDLTEELIDNGVSITGEPETPFRNSGNVNPIGGVLLQVVNGGNPFGSFRAQNNQYSLSQGANSAYAALDASGADDYRFNSMVQAVGQRFYSTKWDADNINVPVIRASEIYLMYAESAARLTVPDLDAASAGYNEVRGFAINAENPGSYVPVNFATAEDALEAIQAERRLELLFEGDRYHELRRLAVTEFGEVRNGSNVIRPAVSFDSQENLLKIPLSETSGNPSIIQN